MPNRQQNYPSGTSRSGSSRSWDDDDNRSSRDWERDYDQGSDSGQRRDTSEESGSTGRYAGYGSFGQGDYSRSSRGNTGQDRYGQSGYGQGGYGQGNYGQPNYSYGQPSHGQDFGSSGTSNYGRSNFGSGQSERGSENSRMGSSSGVGYRGYGGEGLQLAELADRLAPDLIVLGSRGLGGHPTTCLACHVTWTHLGQQRFGLCGG